MACCISEFNPSSCWATSLLSLWPSGEVPLRKILKPSIHHSLSLLLAGRLHTPQAKKRESKRKNEGGL